MEEIASREREAEGRSRLYEERKFPLWDRARFFRTESFAVSKERRILYYKSKEKKKVRLRVTNSAGRSIEKGRTSSYL